MQGARSLPLPLAGASLAQLCGLSAQARPPKSPSRWLPSLKTCVLRVESQMPPEQPLPLGAPSCPSILPSVTALGLGFFALTGPPPKGGSLGPTLPLAGP